MQNLITLFYNNIFNLVYEVSTFLCYFGFLDYFDTRFFFIWWIFFVTEIFLNEPRSAPTRFMFVHTPSCCDNKCIMLRLNIEYTFVMVYKLHFLKRSMNLQNANATRSAEYCHWGLCSLHGPILNHGLPTCLACIAYLKIRHCFICSC